MPSKPSNEPVLLQAKLPRDLRDEFMRAVKDSDDNASRLIRLWVREYLKKVKDQGLQPDLFLLRRAEQQEQRDR